MGRNVMNKSNRAFATEFSVVASSCSNCSIIINCAALDAAFSFDSLLIRLIIDND